MVRIMFCGHHDAWGIDELRGKILAEIESFAKDDTVEFWLGGYGAFDSFALRCCQEYKATNPTATLLFVTPYLNPDYLKKQKNGLNQYLMGVAVKTLGHIFGTTNYTNSTATQQYFGSSSNWNVATYYIPSSLRTVTVTSGNIDFSAFSSCEALTSITILDGVTSIGEWAFRFCRGLTSIIIPESVTSIGKYAFDGCYELTNISIPNTVTTIEIDVFSYCRKITNFYIPEGVTSIGGYAFSYCSALTSITIPNSVNSIGEYAFANCSELIELNYQGTKTQWEAILKDSSWDAYMDQYSIICTDGVITRY